MKATDEICGHPDCGLTRRRHPGEGGHEFTGTGVFARAGRAYASPDGPAPEHPAGSGAALRSMAELWDSGPYDVNVRACGRLVLDWLKARQEEL